MSQPTKPRMLIIGIDGADHLITTQLMAEGRLPNLQAIAERGAWGPISSTIPPVTPPAWTTLMTGKNPGKHGVFDFLAMSGESLEAPIASRRRATTVWRALSDRGLRVGTLNLPVTYPPEALSGFQVSGFDAPAFRADMGAPEAAFRALEATVGDYELFPTSIQNPDGDPKAVAQHADLPVLGTRALLRAFPCDVYMVSFQVVDWVQHGALGGEMAAGNVGSLARDGSVVRTYELVDARLGELVGEWAASETTVVVVSDHGAATADRLVNLEKLFLDNDLMAYTSADRREASRVMARRSRAALALRLWSGIKAKAPWAAARLRSAARRLRGRFAEYQSDIAIDWSRTRAAPWGEYAQIRLNLKGRDPCGIVEEGEVEAVAAAVLRLLASVTDPSTGEAVFRQVLRNDDVYHGPFAADGPDVVGLARSERYLTVSARSGVASLPLLDVQPDPVVHLDPPWGVHSPTGVLFVAGPEVQPGSAPAGAGLADLVPTVLYLLDQPVPEDLDGRALLETVRPAVSSARPPVAGEAWPAPDESAEPPAYSEAERAELESRLRALGYL